MTTTATTATSTATSGPLDPVGVDLMRTLRALKLGGLKGTLPERLVLARQRTMGHAAFLELVLSGRSPAASPARRCSARGSPAWTRPCDWTPGTNPTTSPMTECCSAT